MQHNHRCGLMQADPEHGRGYIVVRALQAGPPCKGLVFCSFGLRHHGACAVASPPAAQHVSGAQAMAGFDCCQDRMHWTGCLAVATYRGNLSRFMPHH